MSKFIKVTISNIYTQLALFFIVNGFFIFKYLPRYNINPYIIIIVFICFVLLSGYVYKKKIHWGENFYKILFISTVSIIILGIIFSLILIDPYAIRVDRWSALSFFWDSVFSGIYPYGVHTHVSESNFASPFPFWHLLNLPFYLLGDVGIGIIAFLILISFSIFKYFGSFKKSFIFLFLLLISPAYWWEILVRSDGLSNTLLAVMFVMWYSKKEKNISQNFILTVLICGLFACTRFSALIPLSLFLFQPYLKLPFKNKILFPLLVGLIAITVFSPFIFWDTENWVFFSRNPFMSQTNNGDFYTSFIMLLFGIIMSLSWKTIEQYFSVTAFTIFTFMLVMQLVRMSKYEDSTFFGDAIVDISYFTLALPYCLSFITLSVNQSPSIGNSGTISNEK